MKLEKIEKYIVELSKDELLFLFEVIDKMQLDPDSSPSAHEILRRFKAFREQEVESSTPCDGCETTQDVTMQLDPSTNQTLPLCSSCFLHRSSYVK